MTKEERAEKWFLQDGALALAQVVPDGLAGQGRVAEDAELVVAQLEGDAQLLPEDGQALVERAAGGRPALQGPDEQGMHDGVAGGFAAHDRQGIAVHAAAGLAGVLIGAGRGQLLTAHVEVLADGDLCGHGVEGRAPGGGADTWQ